MTNPSPDLTVVLELTTGDITGSCDARRNLLAWLSEAAQAFPRKCEFLAVGPRPVQGLAEIACEVPVRFLKVAGAGYYTLKNAGANAAKGRIVLFTDADCRPGAGYITTLLRVFADPVVACVAGRSLHHGSSLLTRINSAHSFGESHCGQTHFDRGEMPFAHNVAVRRDALTRDPFGPFVGRVGGDRYLTDAVRRAGHHILLVDDLIVFHEDFTFSIRGTVERHLRECFIPLGYGTKSQHFSAWFTLACAVALRPALRLRRLLRAGPRLRLKRLDYPVALFLNAGYWAFDLACVLGVLLVPPLRRGWLRFLGPNAG